jgi:hypothetical protein
MPLSSLPSTSPTTVPQIPRARGRRVKRGIVAGYIHDISARHGDESAVPPAASTPAAPAPAPLAPAR